MRSKSSTPRASRKLAEPQIVTIACGCQYMNGGGPSRGPVYACERDRYMRCGKCGGREIIPWEPTAHPA